jgi:hypothetical protein
VPGIAVTNAAAITQGKKIVVFIYNISGDPIGCPDLSGSTIELLF